MKPAHYLLLAFTLFICGCSAKDEIMIEPIDENIIFVFNVDYTTNNFLGGYNIKLPAYKESFTPVCRYKSPSDFGSVEWSDEETGTILFSGTTIWMGKGERTFPEKIEAPDSYKKIDYITGLPEITTLYHADFDLQNSQDIDYKPVWNSIRSLQSASWITNKTYVYAYLYRPSVGVGDPKDWYWIIFAVYSPTIFKTTY